MLRDLPNVTNDTPVRQAEARMKKWRTPLLADTQANGMSYCQGLWRRDRRALPHQSTAVPPAVCRESTASDSPGRALRGNSMEWWSTATEQCWRGGSSDKVQLLPWKQHASATLQKEPCLQRQTLWSRLPQGTCPSPPQDLTGSATGCRLRAQ